jgi:hypothetical protein
MLNDVQCMYLTEITFRYEILLKFRMCHDILNGSGLVLTSTVLILTAEGKYRSCFFTTYQSVIDLAIPVSIVGGRVMNPLQNPQNGGPCSQNRA